jgi:hypothetical protein
MKTMTMTTRVAGMRSRCTGSLQYFVGTVPVLPPSIALRHKGTSIKTG